MKAVRGAIAPVNNNALAIQDAAATLFNSLCVANGITADDILMLLFTATSDLTAAYPAKGVRLAGYPQLPMLCLQEMEVQDSLRGCLRVLAVLDRNLPAVKHVYLGEAKFLRPDLEEMEIGG